MKLFSWYLINNDVLTSALRTILTRLVNGENYLTEDYLINKGWEFDNDGFYYEPGVKKQYSIYIKFHGGRYYAVYLTDKKIFFANECTIEWFELFYLLQHPDNGRHEILENKL
jgi:hypothetical protein